SFRQWGHALIDRIADQVEKVQTNTAAAVIPYHEPAEALAFWQNDFADANSDPLAFFDKVIARSIHLHHPHYIGHQVSVPALVSSLAGMLSDVLSNGTGVYEMGMASNALERVVTDFTAQKIGYPDTASGFLTSGGTLANLTALLAARRAKAPSNVWQEGHQERLAVMVSEEAHYCIDRAARILGMGVEGIIKIPVDSQFKICSELLEDRLRQAEKEGLKVIAIVGCAGSTATGSYDDLNALADFCAKHQLWFHVDGAHGGAVVFSEKHKSLVAGMSCADSVVIDYHKMLMTPALNTALLFREGQRAYETFSQRAQYLWEEQQEPEWYHSGKRTFECTKLMLSIKVYVILRTFGEQVFADNVDRLYAQAKVFASLLKVHPDFELLLEPEANIVNFRYIGGSSESWNSQNALIREKLIQGGAFYIVQTTINGDRYLRCTVMNPLTGKEHFEGLLKEIERLVS
ncbi:MAG: aminotransferase class I/II-fold pyridoxal phosphate-dependent enzyme, partial [Bacteroidota bacterium]